MNREEGLFPCGSRVLHSVGGKCFLRFSDSQVANSQRAGCVFLPHHVLIYDLYAECHVLRVCAPQKFRLLLLVLVCPLASAGCPAAQKEKAGFVVFITGKTHAGNNEPHAIPK